jgi:hypothetical protein
MLRAALIAACAALAASSAASKSKLSIHVNAAEADETIWNFVKAVQPRVLKLLDPTPGSDALVKNISNATILVGRTYEPQQPMTGDPAAAAQAWIQQTQAMMEACPYIDYWEGYNEPPVGTVAQMQWYSAFEVERVRLLQVQGRKASVGQFSAGVPDVTTPAIIAAMYPMVDAAIAAGGILALHEYSSPTLLGCFINSTQQGWLTLRYRMLVSQYLQPTNRSIPIVISESGIDNSPCNSPNLGGWQNYCSYWAQMNPALPGPSDCAQQYVFQLSWYDSLLRQDEYLLGTTIFCYHCDGFDSYEVEPMLPDLQQYMNNL